MIEDKEREKLEETYKKFVEKRDWDKNQLTGSPASSASRRSGTPRTSPRPSSPRRTSSSRAAWTSAPSSAAASACSSALLSDRDQKTNIEKLGTDPATKLPVYAYDYKADVKGKKVAGPKRVGYMAQDVEKKYPKAVKKITGKRVIDFTSCRLG